MLARATNPEMNCDGAEVVKLAAKTVECLLESRMHNSSVKY
jgi:hypothetical protein